MTKTITLLALLAGFLSNAQEKEAKEEKQTRFQVGLHYQPSLKKNYARSNGVGVDVRVCAVSLGPVSLHGSLSGTYLESKDSFFSDIIRINPGLYAEFKLLDFLQPYLGVGYDYYRVKLDENEYSDMGEFDPFVGQKLEETTDFNGFNINPGVRFHFADIVYADLGYNHLSGKYNNNFYADSKAKYNFVHLGFGFRF